MGSVAHSMGESFFAVAKEERPAYHAQPSPTLPTLDQ
jgi:hypothetical protein